MRWMFFIGLFSFCTSCLFSGNDIEETAIVGDYYVVYEGVAHLLVQKEKDAETSAVIISSDIDSIGYNSKYILAVSGDKYFVVEYKSKAAVDSIKMYNSRMDLMSDVKDIVVQKVK